MTGSGIKPFDTTVEDLDRSKKSDAPPAIPGLVLIYSCERPMMTSFPVAGGTLELGRAILTDDERTSRKHARVSFDGAHWKIADLESRNGTFVDGERVDGELLADAPKIMRIGRSIFTFEADVRRFELGIETKDGLIAGPKLREAHAAVERAAIFGDTLFIRGESGSGKELAAKAFHGYGGREAQPFVAVNCAAIPEGLAERLLFGAKKGAYSGALSDAEGYLQAADGGTLFLDEIAELDPAVQAKLLRVLETKQVMALGDAVPRTVELRVCAATHRDLREAVARGRFREDLYFRIGKPEVNIPPLRDRIDEIPWHVARELERLNQSFVAHVGFMETCLLRRWPGNVRELAMETRHAAQAAAAASRTIVEAIDISPSAGAGFTHGGEASAAQHARDQEGVDEVSGANAAASRKLSLPSRESIEDALRAEHGNVTRAAKKLGIHRNQLRRWIERNAVDPRAYGADIEGDE